MVVGNLFHAGDLDCERGFTKFFTKARFITLKSWTMRRWKSNRSFARTEKHFLESSISKIPFPRVKPKAKKIEAKKGGDGPSIRHAGLCNFLGVGFSRIRFATKI